MNQFDSTNYPEREPKRLIVGDRWVWKRTDLGVDYPPADYALRYSARIEGDVAGEIAIDASEDGADYLVEVASATTADYTPGIYHWQIYITRSSDSERITLERGTWEVVADRDQTDADPRSWVKKALDAVRTVLQGTSSKELSTFSVEGMALSRRSPEELQSLERKLMHQYAAEQRVKRVREGRKAGSRIMGRFP